MPTRAVVAVVDDGIELVDGAGVRAVVRGGDDAWCAEPPHAAKATSRLAPASPTHRRAIARMTRASSFAREAPEENGTLVRYGPAYDHSMRNGRLADRVVLITGAGSGIGRACALAAAREGGHIAAIGLDDGNLDALVADVRASGGTAVARAADVSDPVAIAAAVDELVRELGPLHVAFANAGTLTRRAGITELDLDEWHRVLAVDLTGVMLTFRASVPHFPATGGVLLACGSSLAIRPGTGLLPYVAAKAGVHAMARSLALELASRNIRVNVVAPGLADTPMTRSVDGHIQIGLETVPTGRLVELDDIAALAVHLMTDDATSITGSVFTVDAGRTAV
jgi:NAD(P)-dependent dehydrogenase (short-subunit alcohol dehydrogenase family)